MAESARRVPVDYVILADALSTLGYPMRLELLDHLRFPHAASDLRVSPTRQDSEGSSERPVARQTVQYHLDKLVEGGFVREEPVEGKGGARYVVSPSRVYAVIEELRRLSLMFAGRGGGDATGTVAGAERFEAASGPRLILVHGVYEGKQFRLDGDASAWTIGRRQGLPVSLDYDPFVSLETAVVERTEGGFSVRDLAGNKNGTFVNWTRLPRGASVRLSRGDLVGVGRSLLLFRDD